MPRDNGSKLQVAIISTTQFTKLKFHFETQLLRNCKWHSNKQHIKQQMRLPTFKHQINHSITQPIKQTCNWQHQLSTSTLNINSQHKLPTSSSNISSQQTDKQTNKETNKQTYNQTNNQSSNQPTKHCNTQIKETTTDTYK